MTIATGPTRANPQPLHPTSPAPALGEQYLVKAADGSALDAAVLPLNTGVLLVTEVLNCAGWDEAWVLCQYDGAAASTTGFAEILIRGSSVPQLTTPQQTCPPATTDDVWGDLPCIDGSLTATALTGATISGTGEAAGLRGLQQVYGELVRLSAITANSAKVRTWVRIKVRGLRWLHFQCAEGTAANPGKLRLLVVGVV